MTRVPPVALGLLLLVGCRPLGLTIPPTVVAGDGAHRPAPVEQLEIYAAAAPEERTGEGGRPAARRVSRMSRADLERDWSGENDYVRRGFGDAYLPPLELRTCPLVLVWGDDAVEMQPTSGAQPFALGGATCGSPDWPSAATPWLVLDVDGNGSIDGGHELFGTATRLADGARAANGFAALAQLDTNHDGRIDAGDAQWDALRLWRDADGNRSSSPHELTPLAASGITALPLQYHSDPRCDARDNCEIERAAVDADTKVTLVDIHLRCR